VSTGHQYTTEQIEFLRGHVKERDFAEYFNKVFGLQISANALKQVCLRRGFQTGRTGRFKKGHDPKNKGVKNSTGFSSTRFKRGHIPKQWRPVGSERIDSKDGYIYIKTKDPRTWKPKHVHLWEIKNGKVPKGFCIIFGDNNRRNFDQENLICIKRSELLFINSKGINVDDTELTKTAINIAKLVEMGREAKNRQWNHNGTREK